MKKGLGIFPVQEDGSRLLLEINDIRGMTSNDTGTPTKREVGFARIKVVTKENPGLIIVRVNTKVFLMPRVRGDQSGN